MVLILNIFFKKSTMFFRLFKARKVLNQITWLLCDTECQFPISQSPKKEWVVESSNSWQIKSTVMSGGTSVRYVNDQPAEWSNFFVISVWCNLSSNFSQKCILVLICKNLGQRVHMIFHTQTASFVSCYSNVISYYHCNLVMNDSSM